MAHLEYLTLKIEALSSFETSVTTYQQTQHYISEGLKLLKLTFVIIHEDKQYN